MIMAQLMSQLRSLISKVEAVNIVDSSLTADQLSTLTDLTSTLIKSASRLQRKIQSAKQLRATCVQHECEKFKQYAKQYQDDLANGNLPRFAIFRRNIALIFQGPHISSLDRADVKAGKEITRERCAILRSLSMDGVISWAVSYIPTMWAPGNMRSDVFNDLVKDIEPTGPQRYPQKLFDTLIKLKDDLPGNADYEHLLKGNGLSMRAE